MSLTLTSCCDCSAGLEILADIADVDIVLVCCGGGGLVSGIAAAIKLSGNEDCRVYAVEPTGCTLSYHLPVAYTFRH